MRDLPMTNLFDPQMDTGRATTGTQQMCVAGNGFDIASQGAQPWPKQSHASRTVGLA